MFLDVTDMAVDKIFDFMETPDQKLRIKVIGGGCSGLRYELALDEKVNEDDVVIEKKGTNSYNVDEKIKLVVDEKTALYLVGSVLEYVDTIMESGFKVINPNARNTCGCGESFGV